MHSVSFTYREKNYTGYIASNTLYYPQFHWLMLTDPILIREIGDDSIAFIQEDGNLNHYNRVPINHNELVEIARILIEEYLKNKC